jgi:outer membrane biosynthesis protein TonB
VTQYGFAGLTGVVGGIQHPGTVDSVFPSLERSVRVVVVVGAALPRRGGKVDREAVESVVKRRKGAIQYCYERTLKVNPTVSGRITLEYTLGTGGTVVRIDTVENSTGDTHLVECMADRIRQWPFPPTENGTMTFRQSFLFRTSDEASQYIKYKSKEPESTTPVLYTGTYSVSGELDRETVRRYVMTKTSHMARCYQDEMEKRGDLGEGMVKVGWIISPTGKVTGAYIVDTTLHDPAVERCMIDRVSTWLFPSPKGGVSVRVGFPFIFKRK